MIENTDPELLWFIVGLVLLLAELVLPGFVIIFFGVGAWFTALGVGLGLLPTFNIQLLVFLISSVVSLILFRKKGKDFFIGKRKGGYGANERIDDVSGDKAIAVSDIKPGVGGKVEYNGTPWEAEADQEIGKGATVEIVERKNLVLKVKLFS